MDDVLKDIVLLQQLDQFSNANAVVVPSDLPENVTDIETFRALYSYSEKPGSTYIFSAVLKRH